MADETDGGMRGLALLALGLASSLVVGLSPPAQAAPVTVDVTNVRSTKGHVRVAICPKETFLQDSCPFEAMAPSTVGVTTVAFADIPPGTYAAQVFQDEHDDGIVHRDFLGVPTEGIGFSNDAALHFRGPKFNEAAFEVGDQPVRVRLRLRRLLP